MEQLKELWNLISLIISLVLILAIPLNLVRWILVLKAKDDEKRRRKRKEDFNLEENIKPK